MKKEKEAKQIISVQLPVSLLNRLMQEAENSDDNISRIIRIAIKQYLDQRGN